ncbi:putative ligase [Helianthus debilis subsp. tardiflorus]
MHDYMSSHNGDVVLELVIFSVREIETIINNHYNSEFVLIIIIIIVEITHVDVVWLDWGHASEISELVDALEAKGIIFSSPLLYQCGL